MISIHKPWEVPFYNIHNHGERIWAEDFSLNKKKIENQSAKESDPRRAV